MTLLALVTAILVAAAGRELVAARGERAAGVVRRRLRARLTAAAGNAGPSALLAAAQVSLRNAGLAGRLTVPELIAAKAVTAAASLPLALAAAPAAPGRFGLLVLVGVPAASFLAPDLLVASIARRRRSRIAAELPDALDLMATGAASGRGVGRLLEEAMRSSSGPLRDELAFAVAAIECGSSRAAALRDLGDRSRGTTLAALAGALERSRRHGSPLARTLHEQATSLRADQRREVTERAARAAPKMQLVVALLLVPSVLLMVAAAIAANSGSLLPGF